MKKTDEYGLLNIPDNERQMYYAVSDNPVTLCLWSVFLPTDKIYEEKVILFLILHITLECA